ncbi:uncharacterized protein [Montipora capricornis]|uniref:uncharacterized protein n=1 Tax=Montipora capricornis TaxID=246305 RepID=UPI0035F1F1A7
MNTFSTQFDRLKSGMYSLSVGAPSSYLRQMCAHLVQEATTSLHKSQHCTSALQYGLEQGPAVFRSELAKFLSEVYGDAVNYEDLWVNAGASQGLDLLGHVLFQPGDVVFVEEPSYFIGLRALKDDLGMRVIGVPTDKDGMMVDELENLITEHSNKFRLATDEKPYSSMLYCVPTFNNPTGSCLAPERCEKLIKVLRKHNVLALCDDVYNLLSFVDDAPAPQRLFAYDNKSDADYRGNVISNGSFSKVLAPGLRIGWMEVPEKARKLLSRNAYNASGGCFNQYISCIISVALGEGLVKEHLMMARQNYRSQCDALCNALDKYIPIPISYQKPKGGYFVWVSFPPEVDCIKLFEICKTKYLVEFKHGCVFSTTPGKFKNCMRLSFGFNEPDILEHCVKQIAFALKESL